LEFEQIKAEDLKSPSAATVQPIYLKFLREFGFNNESMLMPSIELLDSLDHPDIMKDMVPLLSLQAACSFMLQRLVDEHSFGIMDLQRPSGKRTQSFFSVLQNFWLFCNQRVGETDEVQQEVENLVKAKKNFENLIEDYKTKINRYKSKAVEDRANEEAIKEEIEEYKKQLESQTQRTEELNEEKRQLAEEMAKMQAMAGEIETKKQELQSEIDKLQGMFEGAATLKKLDEEMAELSEEQKGKQKRKLEFRNNLEVLERTKEEYNAILELVKQIAKEEEKIREVVGKIREQQSQIDAKKMEQDELENDLREAENEVAEKAAEVNKISVQWNRRKVGRQEELAERRAARDLARTQVGEEQIVAIDLGEQLRDLELMKEEENTGMAEEATSIRMQYAKLLEAMERFYAKMKNDMTKIEAAAQRLNVLRGEE